MNISIFFDWFNILPVRYSWVLQVALVFIITLTIRLTTKFIYHKTLPKLKNTERIWDDVLIVSLYKPLKLFIWFIGLLFVYKFLAAAYPKALPLSIIHPAKVLGFIFFIIWFVNGFIQKMELRLIEQAKQNKVKLEKTSIDAFSKFLRLIIIIIGLLFILQASGISLSVVMAFSGGGAIVIGLAAKDILANFFGGLMIYLDRPFSVGDWIASPDKEIEGTVEYIGWRLTKIRTFNKRPLYVPNAMFSTLAIQNPSRMTNRRIKTTLGLRYCDAPRVASIVKDIEEMLRNHHEIDTRQTLFVKLVGFGESSLNILIYTFTKTTQWVKFQAIQEDIFLKIINIIYDKHEASMAFPTRTIEMSNSSSVGEGKNFSINSEKET